MVAAHKPRLPPHPDLPPPGGKERKTCTKIYVPVLNLTSTHKNWWECDTGIAYIVAHKKEEGWRSRGVKIFDLSDPAQPRYIRDYGVAGQEPGSSGEPVPAALHGPIRLGNRVYFGYGTNAGGILQIVDRDKLLQGDPTSPDPFAPTAHNILYAQSYPPAEARDRQP